MQKTSQLTSVRLVTPILSSGSGDEEVWSNSKNAWMKDGQILEVATADSDGADPSVGEGSLKVKCGAGVKWIKPEYIAQQLRKISKISKYAEGDRVHVWSASKNDWIPDGLVLEVTTVEAVITGYKVGGFPVAHKLIVFLPLARFPSGNPRSRRDPSRFLTVDLQSGLRRTWQTRTSNQPTRTSASRCRVRVLRSLRPRHQDLRCSVTNPSLK